MLLSDGFKCILEVENDHHSLLEFEPELDGILINGIDNVNWNEEDKIIDFKVMLGYDKPSI